MKLTQEEKRVKIAEACGWVWHPAFGKAEDYNSQQKAEAILCWCAPGDEFWRLQELPDYFNDLNAMHYAEKILSSLPNEDKQISDFTQQEQFVQKLEWITESEVGLFKEVHATAAQRAEAIGLTLHLWEAGE